MWPWNPTFETLHGFGERVNALSDSGWSRRAKTLEYKLKELLLVEE